MALQVELCYPKASEVSREVWGSGGLSFLPVDCYQALTLSSNNEPGMITGEVSGCDEEEVGLGPGQVYITRKPNRNYIT